MFPRGKRINKVLCITYFILLFFELRVFIQRLIYSLEQILLLYRL